MDAFSFLILVFVFVCFGLFLPTLIDMFKESIAKRNRRRNERNRRRNRNQNRSRPQIGERTRALRENARLNLDAQKAMYDMLQEAIFSQSEHDEDELPD